MKTKYRYTYVCASGMTVAVEANSFNEADKIVGSIYKPMPELEDRMLISDMWKK